METADQPHLMMAHANGSSGYIAVNAAFEQVSYEIESSRLKAECAENAFVNVSRVRSHRIQSITSIRARCPGALASGLSQVTSGASIASASAT